MVQTEIASDFPEPGAKGSLAAVRGEMLPGARKDLLNDVLGIVPVVQETQAERKDLLAIGLAELIEGPTIACPRREEVFLFCRAHRSLPIGVRLTYHHSAPHGST